MMLMLLAVFAMLVTAPEAKAKQVDAVAVAQAYLAYVESLAGDIDPWVQGVLQDMRSDIDAAVAKGRLKGVLKLEKRYSKTIDKAQGKFESALDKERKKVSKAFEGADKGVAISFGPVIYSAVTEAKLEMSTGATYLRDQLADLVDQAVARLAASRPEGESGHDD